MTPESYYIIMVGVSSVWIAIHLATLLREVQKYFGAEYTFIKTFLNEINMAVNLVDKPS